MAISDIPNVTISNGVASVIPDTPMPDAKTMRNITTQVKAMSSQFTWDNGKRIDRNQEAIDNSIINFLAQCNIQHGKGLNPFIIEYNAKSGEKYKNGRRDNIIKAISIFEGDDWERMRILGECDDKDFLSWCEPS